jgi:WD40 repeat protein
MAFSPDSRTLAIGTADLWGLSPFPNSTETARLLIWDITSGTTKMQIAHAKADSIWDIEFSPDGRFLVAGLHLCDDPVGLWKIDEPQASSKPQIDKHGK